MPRRAKDPLGGLTTDALAAELKRRQRGLGSLQTKRARLLARLAAIDAQIRAAGGLANGVLLPPGRKRPVNDANLADSLAKVLTGKTMSVTQVADAVQAAGYSTTSPNFRTIVNQTLIKDKRIKRVGRGRYTAKAASGGTRGRKAAKGG